MKMVSFRVRNFDKEQFLTFDIDNEAELDEDVLDFLEDEEPSGIVPVIFEDDDEEFDTFSYDITNKIHLSELSNQEINAEMVLMVLRGIVIALTDMTEYRIPLSYLVLNRDYIYIDSDYKVEFICIPLEEMQEDVNVNSFLRNFIASLRFDVTEDVSYVARLLTYVNNTAIFNLHNLLTMVEELMEDHGIEIPEDDSSEIYADYQEVEEKSAADLVEELDEEDDLEEQTEEEEISDDVPVAEGDISEEPEEEESAQAEEEEASDEPEPQKSGLSSKFSIKQPVEDDEEEEPEPEEEEESEEAEPKKSSLSSKFSIKQSVEDDEEEESEPEEEEPEDAEPKKSNLSSKFSLKEPEPDEEETAVTEEETDEETDTQPDEADAVEESEEQSEETAGEEEIAEETKEEVSEEVVEEEPLEEEELQEEEMSEEIESLDEEDTQEEESSKEDELSEDEPSMDEADEGPAEEEVSEEADEEDVIEEAVADSTAQEIVNKLKNKVIGGRKKTNTSENEESGEDEEDKKEQKKPVFKTKEVTGVVIPDELDEFLAEKEREEQENKENHHEESSLKIKKNIKVNRASIVKSTQEELKENESLEEDASGKEDASEDTKNDGGEAAADSGAEQSGGKTGILKSAPAPKVNPYLVRVNTEERIMITKQTFKLGKASMGVDYTVKGNSAVSRVHAIITNKDGEYFVKDNKSTNHTYVNGKILNDGDNEPLAHDSKIMLGDEEFIFKLQ